MRVGLSVAVLAFAVLPLTGAQAIEFPSHAHSWGPIVNPDCTCRFKGENVPLGTMRCLQTAEGPRTAQCVKEQNITSWRPGQDICPQAALSYTPRG